MYRLYRFNNELLFKVDYKKRLFNVVEVIKKFIIKLLSGEDGDMTNAWKKIGRSIELDNKCEVSSVCGDNSSD